MPNNSDKPRNSYKDLMGLGVQIVVQVLLGILLGMWLDKHFGKTNSMFTIIFAIVAIGLSLYQFIKLAFKE